MDRWQFCAALGSGLVLGAWPAALLAQGALPSSPLDAPGAINLAGRLRMLSQRSVKAYLMLGQGIEVQRAQPLLLSSLERIEAHLQSLRAWQPTPKVSAALGALAAASKPCLLVLRATPSKAGASALYDASDALQQAAHTTTLAYEQVNASPIEHLIALAGRQRMLSQRMAMLYLYCAWGLYDAPAHVELHLSRARFIPELAQIEASQLATPQIRSDIAAIRREWEPYQARLLAQTAPAQMRQDAPAVVELSERLLVALEALVERIVALARATPATAR